MCMHACICTYMCIYCIWMYLCECMFIHVPRAHEVKNQRVIAKRTSQIMKYGQDVIIQKRTDDNGAPDRVNIPCLMHDTRLCQ